MIHSHNFPGILNTQLSSTFSCFLQKLLNLQTYPENPCSTCCELADFLSISQFFNTNKLADFLFANFSVCFFKASAKRGKNFSLKEIWSFSGIFFPYTESLFEVVAWRILDVCSSESFKVKGFRYFEDYSINFTFAKWILLKDYLCLGAFDVTQLLKLIKLELFGELDMATTQNSRVVQCHLRDFDLFLVSVHGSCCAKILLCGQVASHEFEILLFAFRRNLIGFNYFLGS